MGFPRDQPMVWEVYWCKEQMKHGWHVNNAGYFIAVILFNLRSWLVWLVVLGEICIETFDAFWNLKPLGFTASQEGLQPPELKI